MPRPTAIVTGASSGIGAIYAERLAARGYDLILIGRDMARLRSAANLLTGTYATSTTPLPLDLSIRADLELLLKRIREDKEIELLVNSAGVGPSGGVLDSDDEVLERMLHLNVSVLHALSVAAAKAFSQKGSGAIINIASVVALMPERFNGSYSAGKAFVLSLTQALDVELRQKGVRVQAVLPGFTRTEIFERAGLDTTVIPSGMMMDAGDMVDAALAGFDAGELVTIPSLRNENLWKAFDAARHELGPHLSLDRPAPRYLGTVPQ
ncbi:SDR family NAD(P)-dependent oxidoreductase [Rhizobium glycinendophyticum]|uniref:SDR family oxidoreductase n=1 Tax=Rhizobium glycinendophyticum TaxID=2589807 RepID=A0A504UKW1_9HYPH|nr:SDR family oxidoreductase [Rhizobium glycinendophyticum]TPP06052.1 SDR family oxidoreductase [Rhizobium glycinendophyticum]